MTKQIEMKTTAYAPQRRTPLMIVALVLFWVPVIVFSKLAGEIIEKEPIAFDNTILLWIYSHATPFYNRVFLIITTIGNLSVIVPITLLIVGGLLYKEQSKKAFIVFTSVAGAICANIILKLLFQRERPDLWHSIITETTYSFPSGHALISTALILSIVAITWRTRARWPVLVVGSIFIALIGISRLYLGVHYPSDVIAGWSIGIVWVFIVCVVARKIFRTKS
jgi:membrane-associated phospholipid phosphatase